MRETEAVQCQGEWCSNGKTSAMKPKKQLTWC